MWMRMGCAYGDASRAIYGERVRWPPGSVGALILRSSFALRVI